MIRSENMHSRQPKGSGSFRQMKNGNWNHRKKVRRSDGEEKVFSVTEKTRPACIKAMDKLVADFISSGSSTNEDMTLCELCQAHLDYDEKNDHTLELTSINRRQGTINQLKLTECGNMPLWAIKAPLLKAEILNLKSIKYKGKLLSVSSREKAADVVNAAYRWGMLNGYISSNAIEPIKREIERLLLKESSKGTKQEKVIVLDKKQQEQFINEATKKTAKGKYKYCVGLIALFLLYTGLRVGELLALRWYSYDEKKNLLTIEKTRSPSCDKNAPKGQRYILREGDTKNDRNRTIQLNDKAIYYLNEIRKQYKNPKPDDYIVLTKNNKPDTTSNIENKIAILYRNANIRLRDGSFMTRPHNLRHTFATNLYDKGKVPIEIVAAYIGDTVDVAIKYYVSTEEHDEDSGVYVAYPE